MLGGDAQAGLETGEAASEGMWLFCRTRTTGTAYEEVVHGNKAI